MNQDFQVMGTNSKAPFTLKLHRGDGMTLLAMNWKKNRPPADFAGFGIEYREPGGDRFFALKNRLNFPGVKLAAGEMPTTLRAPIQMFRWVHFPRNADLAGAFTYRVTPVFMNNRDELSFGEAQTAEIELRRETFPGQLNVAFTRGFVSSQAFVDRFESEGPISMLLPAKAAEGLDFIPTHPKSGEALDWMGFEARQSILELLDAAIAEPRAQVRVIAYDLNVPEVVTRLEKLGSRLRILIDDDGDHGEAESGETHSAARLALTAGEDQVRRQHMGKLQHNKMIVVDGPKLKAAVCGSTNFSWRGFYVQSNNAVVVRGKKAIQPFLAAFENFWNNSDPDDFGQTGSAEMMDLGLSGINAHVSFSPHAASNALLDKIAADIAKAKSSLFYSLAFLSQTEGPIKASIAAVTAKDGLFVYGISDKKTGGLDLQKPNGNIAPVFSAELTKTNTPEPFKSEPSGGFGTRMHHKFAVIDFDKPTARVYFGSYNFSKAADRSNGENLLLIRDRRIAVSYMIEALRIFDHYHFRVNQRDAAKAKKKLELAKPPRAAGELPWFDPFFTDARKIRDREIFA